MARSGSFGRLPRALPSLTSTLIAIAREQESQRDQNIMSAWQKGGMFEGRKVTDNVMLEHWRKRLDGIDKDDPLYDAYKNAILQYTYAIEESKMTVRLAQGKISKSQAAQFYSNWAKRIPEDSEFYRILQRDAANLLRQAKNEAKAASAAAEEERYRDRLTRIEREKERPGQFAMQVLTYLAQKGANGRGAFLAETDITSPDRIVGETNIGSMELGGIDSIQWLISQVNQRPGDAEHRIPPQQNSVLFTDDMGKTWTQQDVWNEFAKTDPTFTGFSLEYVGGLLKTQRDGLKDRIAIATKTGHTSDAANLRQQLARVNELTDQMNAIPVLDRYNDLKRDQERIKNDATLLPKARAAAIEENLAAIGALANDPSIATNGHLRSQLTGEATLQTGITTVWEDLNGTDKNGMTNAMTDDGTSWKAGEIGSLRAMLESDHEVADAVDAGVAIMTQGKWSTDSTGARVFTAQAGGKQWGTITPEAMYADAGKFVAMRIPNGDGSTFSTVAVQTMDIKGVVSDKGVKSLVTMEDGVNDVIGKYVTLTIDGKQVTMFQHTNASGASWWNTTPNFDPDVVKFTPGKDGGEADLSNVLRSKIAEANQTDGSPMGDTIDLGGGVRVLGKQRTKPRGYESTTGGDPVPGDTSYVADYGRPVYDAEQLILDPGKIVYHPAQVASGTEPANLAGYNPKYGDSFSPTIVALSALPDGPAYKVSLTTDAAYKALVQSDAIRYSGADVSTGVPVFKDPAAKTYYDEFQAGATHYTTTPLSDSHERSQFWKTTVSTPVNAPTTQRRPSGRVTGVNDGLLPTDRLAKAGDTRFHGLWSGMVPGTNNFNTNAWSKTTQQGSGPMINTGPSFTLPSVNPNSLPMNFLSATLGGTNTVAMPTQQATQPATSPLVAPLGGPNFNKAF